MAKRILAITNTRWFEGKDSASLTMLSFMGGYPKEDIFTISCRCFNEPLHGLICDRCYQLTVADIHFARFFFKNKRKANETIGTPVMDSSVGDNVISFKRYIRYFLASCFTVLTYRISRSLKRFIEDAKPDIIYSDAQNLATVKLVRRISTTYHIPIIFHFLDDWPNTEYKSSLITKPFSLILNKEIKGLLKETSSVFCISDVMCREYERRYHGKDYITMLNSIDDFPDSREPSEKVTLFAYAGSLYLDRDKTLLSICKALAQKNILSCRLDIFSNPCHWESVKQEFINFPFVHYLGFISHDDLMERLRNYDVLLFVESFNKSLIQYSKYSLSTRIPEYLATGRIILAIGPSGQASLDYLKDNQVAYVVNEEKEIISTIDELASRKDKNLHYFQNSRSLFLKNHLKSSQQKKFNDLVAEITNNNSL